MSDPRRAIPSIDRLLGSQPFAALLARYPRARVVDAARRAVEHARTEVGASPEELASPARYARHAAVELEAAEIPSLRRVVNATGVVLHTNLGRAPLAVAAREAMTAAAEGYSNLEYDLDGGRRGSRYDHCVDLLTELTGAEDALVVNNNAAALVLALDTVARGRGVAVSRGELVEIGGGFRVPEIMARSGATLVEVGSTNRTRIEDYRRAAEGSDLAALLKVHRSNFRVEGFTESASLSELRDLADALGVPLLYDLGSGLLADPNALGLPVEPRPAEAVAAGADVVVVSGDKLLGGPQAGLVVGRASVVAAMRRNPLCRALRVDKVALAGLEATLRLYRDPRRALREIPTLRMLGLEADALRNRAEALRAELEDVEGVAVRAMESAVGGGTYPGVTLPSWGLSLTPPAGSADRLAAALRRASPPVVGRIDEGDVLLDLRTVAPEEEPWLLTAIREAERGA